MAELQQARLRTPGVVPKRISTCAGRMEYRVKEALKVQKSLRALAAAVTEHEFHNAYSLETSPRKGH